MKVLFISHHLKGNDGWSRYARDLIFGIRDQGVEVLCLVNELDPKTDIPQLQVLDKGPLAYVVNPIISFRNAKKVNKVIDDFKPDILHVVIEPYVMTVPFIKKKNIKIALGVYSTFAYLPILVKGIKRKISEFFSKLYFKKVDLIIPISRYTEDHLNRHMQSIGGLKYVEGKSNIVIGWVDPKLIVDTKPELHNSPKEILFVGAIKPRKGLVEAIESLALVKTPFIYRIAGRFDPSDKYVKLINERIEALNLKDKVVFLGGVSDQELDRLYAKADLFLMLSTNNGADFEGFGLVYLEANAKGVPTIGPGDSGVSDAIVEGKTGYLVNQFDPEEVAEKIDAVLRDGSIKSSDCIAWAKKNTSVSKAKEVFDLYNKILLK